MGNSDKKGSDESMDSQMEEADLRARLLQVRLMRGLAAFWRATEEDKQEVLRRWSEAVGIEPN
jgi:chromatin segregation and condensation protein Rec8/ScpA/Scc1 (kleisin family)